MQADPQDLNLAVIRWAVQLLDRHGAASEDPDSDPLADREAKRTEWRGFKIKFRMSGDRHHQAGRLRIRIHEVLMLYARLDRGWMDNPDLISDLRAKPGSWREDFLALR